MNSTELTENKSTNFAAPRVTDSICQHASHSMKAEKRTQISKTCSFHLDSNCSCFTTVYIIMTLWVEKKTIIMSRKSNEGKKN